MKGTSIAVQVCFAIAALLAIASASALPAKLENLQKNRIIVVVDSSSYQHTHSKFFTDLTDQGYELDFKVLNSPSIKLMTFGEYNYDHMIIIAAGAMDGRGLTKVKIGEFFDSGRNVFIATDVDASKSMRAVFNEFGVEVDEYGSRVRDHFNNEKTRDHSHIESSNVILQKAIVPSLSKPILFRGVGLTMTPYETHQVFGVLRGQDSAYSFSSEKQVTINSGSDVVLVSATQGRNNARAILTGSIELMSNDFYRNENYANREFVSSVLLWNFGLTGVLRVGEISARLANSSEEISEIRIKDFLDYSIEIFEYVHAKSTWVPYVATDLNLEFTMLDPYIRTPLIQNAQAKYTASFQVPEKHGIFKLSLKYEKPGFTFIQETKKVTVRPFKHDEYPRYLLQAYPYYFSTWATIAGFVVFVVCFLLHDERSKSQPQQVEATSETKKSQ